MTPGQRPRDEHGVAFWLDEDGRHVHFSHRCTTPHDPELEEMYGAPLPLGPDGWRLVSVDPITVTPSILCKDCDIHGFITDGKWMPV